MSLLVFGKTGQVARELAARAPDATYLGREDADLSDPAAVAAALKAARPSLVINAAAWTAVDKAEEEEATATLVNGEAPGAMARAAAELGVPFLHISTDYVFDGTGETPWTEDAPVAPLGAYGRTKLLGEASVRAAGGEHVILRTAWVFSSHGANFVKTMLRLSETRDALSIVDDQIGGPTHAGAIAEALLTVAAACRAGKGVTGTYHFAGTPHVSWAGFAREIFAAAGREVAVTPIPSSGYPTPAERPKNSRLDCAKIAADYGVQAPDWRAGLATVLKELSHAT